MVFLTPRIFMLICLHSVLYCSNMILCNIALTKNNKFKMAIRIGRLLGKVDCVASKSWSILSPILRYDYRW